MQSQIQRNLERLKASQSKKRGSNRSPVKPGSSHSIITASTASCCSFSSFSNASLDASVEHRPEESRPQCSPRSRRRPASKPPQPALQSETAAAPSHSLHADTAKKPVSQAQSASTEVPSATSSSHSFVENQSSPAAGDTRADACTPSSNQIQTPQTAASSPSSSNPASPSAAVAVAIDDHGDDDCSCAESEEDLIDFLSPRSKRSALRSQRRQQRSQNQLVKAVTFHEELNVVYDDERLSTYGGIRSSQAMLSRRLWRDKQCAWYERADYTLFRFECSQTVRWMRAQQQRGKRLRGSRFSNDFAQDDEESKIEHDLLEDEDGSAEFCSLGLALPWKEMERRENRDETIQTVLDEQAWIRHLARQQEAQQQKLQVPSGELEAPIVDEAEHIGDIYFECCQNDYLDAQERAARLCEEIHGHRASLWTS